MPALNQIPIPFTALSQPRLEEQPRRGDRKDLRAGEGGMMWMPLTDELTVYGYLHKIKPTQYLNIPAEVSGLPKGKIKKRTRRWVS